MPLYEFICTQCSLKFEALKSFQTESVPCPDCGAEAIRTLSLPGPLKKGAFPFKPGAPMKMGNPAMGGMACGGKCGKN